MTDNSLTAARFIVKGRAVKVGAKVRDFRGDVWTFLGVAELPRPEWGKTGRVRVKGGTWESVYYPSVFDGHIEVGR